MLFLANLDAERSWAGLPPERGAIRERLSVLGALLAVFADHGDRVWTREPIDGSRVEALSRRGVRFVSGALPSPSPSEHVRAWGVTAEVAHLTGGSAAAAARANDRRRQAGWSDALSGVRELHGAKDLAAHLASGGAASSPTGQWVVKAPFSAAGRERLRGSGLTVPAVDRTRLERLFVDYGTLVFEPWRDVLCEFGTSGIIDDSGVRFVGAHRQELGRGGAVASITLDDSVRTPAFEQVGEALSRDGYRGPFGIDSYTYRDTSGRACLNPVSEVNGRLTFGAIARAAAVAYGVASGSLEVGREPSDRSTSRTVLVSPAAPDHVGAWLRRDVAT